MNDIEKQAEPFYAVVERAILSIDEVKTPFTEAGIAERFVFITELFQSGEPRLAVEILIQNLFDFQIVISHNLHDALKAVLQGAEYVYDKNGNFLRFDSAANYSEMLNVIASDSVSKIGNGD